jgi:hypothetical protein
MYAMDQVPHEIQDKHLVCTKVEGGRREEEEGRREGRGREEGGKREGRGREEGGRW